MALQQVFGGEIGAFVWEKVGRATRGADRRVRSTSRPCVTLSCLLKIPRFREIRTEGYQTSDGLHEGGTGKQGGRVARRKTIQSSRLDSHMITRLSSLREGRMCVYLVLQCILQDEM